ncbi:retrovirus-related pol polyprotein from transposon TNT 1-94 [Tanacetum coccineum]
MSKGKSKKGLVAKSFDWEDESVSSEDEGVTRVKEFMVIIEDDLPIGKTGTRSGQWVEITMKKVQRLIYMTNGDERKHVLDYTHVDLHYVEDQRKNLLIKFNSLNQELSSCKSELNDLKNTKALNCSLQNEISRLNLENESLKDEISDLKRRGKRKDAIFLKEVLFTKVDESPSRTTPKITSDSESECDNQEPLPPLPKLLGAEPIDSGYSRYVIEVKQYLHGYSKESGPKVVFGDNSSGDTEGYGLVNCSGITFTRVAYVIGLKHNLISISQLCDANFKVLFTKTQGTIFNQNNEVVMITPRRRDVYVIDMSSYNEESNAYFFSRASNSVNWLWHKRLTHLNFKNINKLTRQNLVAGLPSLTFFKNKTCLACKKGKHHRALFKTKRSFCISKCLHLFHMDLFGPVKPQTISHNKYTLVIVDEYSRGRSPYISYFNMFGCPMRIHNHKDHLEKFDEKVDDGFFLGYSPVAKASRVFNVRRQEMEETYHVTFNEDDEAITKSSTEGDEINFN